MAHLVPELPRVVEVKLPRLVVPLHQDRRHHLRHVHLQRAFGEEGEVPLIGGDAGVVVHHVGRELEVVEAAEPRVAPGVEIGNERRLRPPGRQRGGGAFRRGPGDPAGGIEVRPEVVPPRGRARGRGRIGPGQRGERGLSPGEGRLVVLQGA